MTVDAQQAPSTWMAVRRSPAVLRLTSSVAVSEVGTQVTFLALPLLALLQLGAGAGVVGLLTAAQFVPIIEAVARHHDAAELPVTGLDTVHALHVADAIVSGLLEAEDGGNFEERQALDEDYLESIGLTDIVNRMMSNASL